MNYDSRISAEKPEQYSAESAVGESFLERHKRTIVLGAIVLIGAILALGGYLMLRGGDSAVGAGKDESQAPVITVISPGQATIEGQISATGTLSARREIPVGVVGEGGRVANVPVDAGIWVRKGQVLARIDRSVQSQQARAANSQVAVARADAQLAQSNLDRALKLVDRGFVSKADVDRLTATRDAAIARVKVASAQYSELLARNARLNIVAPVAGFLLERNVEPGQTVGAGSGPLFRIAKGGEMEMNARVGEIDLAKISAGVSAQVTPVGTDKSFSGQVWQVAPTINPNDRQGTVRIALAYAPELRPGGFASATIRSGTMVASLLPESAIQSDDKGSFVLIAGKDNKVERRDIELGAIRTDGIVVKQGISGNERIVLRAGAFLNPGQTIKPVKLAAAKQAKS